MWKKIWVLQRWNKKLYLKIGDMNLNITDNNNKTKWNITDSIKCMLSVIFMLNNYSKNFIMK